MPSHAFSCLLVPSLTFSHLPRQVLLGRRKRSLLQDEATLAEVNVVDNDVLYLEYEPSSANR